MTTRISSAGMHYRALNALLDQQSRLAKTQQQIASGKRVITPADDPVGATRIQDLSRQIAASEQYLRNNDAVRSRLSLEEQSLSDAGSALNRIRELVVEASNDTVDASSRHMIANEIRGNIDELLALANRKDGQGEYLFSGLATQTLPFARVGGSVQYFGDQGSRSQQVSETLRVADGDTGFDVFGRITEGNGTFVTSAAATNTGSGSVSVGTLVDRAAWPGGTFRVQFTAADTWQVVDSATPAPNVVASGTYASGNAITFAGVSVQVSGTPAAGDEFVVRPATTTDLFSSLDALVATLESDPATPAERAQFRTALNGSMQQVDRSLDHMLEVRSSVGVRLNTLDVTQSAQEDAGVNLQSLLSEVQDLDYAEAVTRLNVQYTGLQAAQKSLANVAQLSLFDYL